MKSEESIIQKVADCLVRAGSTFREDQKEAYRKAIADEKVESSCWVMKQVLDNALVAEKNRSPLCDDTGIPHVIIEMGSEREITQDLISQIKEGIYFGLAICDISTGSFYTTEIKEDNNFSKLLDEISRYNPSEIIVNQMMSDSIEEIKAILPDYYADYHDLNELKLKIWQEFDK